MAVLDEALKPGNVSKIVGVGMDNGTGRAGTQSAAAARLRPTSITTSITAVVTAVNAAALAATASVAAVAAALLAECPARHRRPFGPGSTSRFLPAYRRAKEAGLRLVRQPREHLRLPPRGGLKRAGLWTAVLHGSVSSRQGA